MNTHPKVYQTRRFWLNVQGCLGSKLPPQDTRRLAQLRAAARSGEPLPIQLCHTLEVLGSDLDYVNDVRDVNGVYGGSPAATIAMLNRSRMPQLGSIAFLSAIAVPHESGLPVVTSIETFERSWVFYNFMQAGVPVCTGLARVAAHYFTARLSPQGTSCGPGLPQNADDSAMVLSVLSDLGYPVEPVCLLTHEAETYFRCFDGERTPSVSTNAHILEAFKSYTTRYPLTMLKYRAAIAKISTYLLSVQRKDGSWIDKWHASPYYSTASSVLALRRFGLSDRLVAALDQAISWVLHTQRDDGSWGVWCGTLEETAYALQMLMLAGQNFDAAAITQAALLGERFLMKHLNAPSSDPVRIPLWHGKELYEPGRVVRATVLSALYLCARTLSKAQPLGEKRLVGCTA